MSKTAKLLVTLGIMGALVHGWWEITQFCAPYIFSEKDLAVTPPIALTLVITLLAVMSLMLTGAAISGLWALGDWIYRKLGQLN